MSLERILKLGNPELYRVSDPVEKKDISSVIRYVELMDQIITDFRLKYGAGRAIAAPQVGILKRFIYLRIDKPYIIINPEIFDKSESMIELWDDCMSFPDLMVKVRRHKSCRIKFFDEEWNQHEWLLEDDMSELLQHEYDHLDGILATQRAIDNRSFALRSEIENI
jgi:peptide deformylase